MSGPPAASLPIRRSALALMLCVLAFLFAYEAKLAWYSPARDIYGQVSAAKALPADVPALVAHGTLAPDHMQIQVAFSAFAILVAFTLAASEVLPGRQLSSSRPSFFIPLYLLPPIDSRPPPAR